MKGSLFRWLFLLASVMQCQSFLQVPPVSFAAGRVASKSMANDMPLSGAPGDISIVSDGINITDFVNPDELLPLSPPLSYEKYMTMQVCVHGKLLYLNNSLSCHARPKLTHTAISSIHRIRELLSLFAIAGAAG